MRRSSASASRAERALLLSLSFAGLLGCESNPCADLPADCTPLYEPSFRNVHANTLVPSCAVAGASCHAAEGRQGGLDFSAESVAHAALSQVALPSDVACSPVLLRLESTDPGFGMPPGRPLSAEERCAVRRWIEAGAPR